MTLLAASAPLIVVLASMGVLRWPAAKAGAAGTLITLVLALGFFDLSGIAPTVEVTWAIAGIFTEALHSTFSILWVVLPALSIYELQQRTGALEVIREALVGLTDDRVLQAVLIAWFFGLFMEGAAGFGTPVALAAPLLVGLGYPPITAVAMALVGHAAGVSFGAVGTPIFAQAEITGLPAAEIGVATALLHAALGTFLVAVVMRMAGAPLSLRIAIWALLAGACFFVPFVALAILAGPELPTLGGALAGAIMFVVTMRWRAGGRAKLPAPASLLLAAAPYLIILALVLATRLIDPLPAVLGGIQIGWSLHDTFRGTFQPFYHPGTILLLGFVLGGLATGRASHLLPAAVAAAARVLPVAAALLAMLAMARLMVHSGMIATLAEGAASSGAVWPLLAPAVGVLGTFVTGSATASSILFAHFQLTTAGALALPATTMVAAQGFGAAIGNIVAPHNIIAGAATVGLHRREGDILARTAVTCATYAVAGGLLVMVLVTFATVPL
ncbi:L-lactate permease [Pelagibacterium lentulum]|uniref:L-lactate permease n=1 Tax=Pelagibacterium lentulum TaxID=2029865 RepID=A0A916RAK4_9HYPH|nr:L-lactate permease [Pelagibacterium lentulum]GGA50018.1 L-lactate permease [Pelagibacterium lentulum]